VASLQLAKAELFATKAFDETLERQRIRPTLCQSK